MEKENFKRYLGKILLKDNSDYKWMFKVIDITRDGNFIVTHGMDIYPQPRAYHSVACFNETFSEQNIPSIIRLPNKHELNLYRKYTRELILLGTNVSDYGRK